jgi:DNA-binding response OmpR family regulator
MFDNISGKMISIKSRILWVDDEIEMLKSNIMYLRQKGYDVVEAANGEDAIEIIKNTDFDLVFLDEMMPGKGGLETLIEIKDLYPNLPVVMVTKNETESLMEEAIGKKITDYLLKPVHPNQLLLVCKKVLESKTLRQDQVSKDFISEFNNLSNLLSEANSWEDWVNIHIKMTNWELELDEHPELGLKQIAIDQRREVNVEFSKFIEKNYFDWVNFGKNKPVLSNEIIDKYVIPELGKYKSIFFFVVDCMRLDQWLVMEKLLNNYFKITKEYYSAILPTATPYCRNAIFAGLFPSDIEKHYPNLWEHKEDDENSRNNFEREFLNKLLERRKVKLHNELKYIKIMDPEFSRGIESKIPVYINNHLNAIVINFVDMMAHSRSDTAILKEIAPDESAYRSLTSSWFEHSSFFGMLRQLASRPDIKVIITTDHGSIRCLHGVKAMGDRESAVNLRYKYGRNVRADNRNAIYIPRPVEYKIPKRDGIVNYIIAKEDFYFIYPTDYHKFLNQYNDTFQHGGISTEEMILPVAILESKS